MSKIVNRQYIDEYLEANRPNALTKLSNASRVPAQSIQKIKTGRVSKKEKQRQKLAKALGVDEGLLFPTTPDGKERAS